MPQNVSVKISLVYSLECTILTLVHCCQTFSMCFQMSDYVHPAQTISLKLPSLHYNGKLTDIESQTGSGSTWTVDSHPDCQLMNESFSCAPGNFYDKKSQNYKCDKQRTAVPLHLNGFFYAWPSSRDSCTCKRIDHTWNPFYCIRYALIYKFLKHTWIVCSSFLYSDLKSQELHWSMGAGQGCPVLTESINWVP